MFSASQRVSRRPRVVWRRALDRRRAKQQSIALLAPRPRYEFRVRIDSNDPDCRIELGGGHPFDGEIERLAEQHDEIGALCDLAQRTQRRVRESARAFQNDCRRSGGGFKFRQQHALGRARQLRTGEYERPFGGGEQRKNFAAVGVAERSAWDRFACRPRHGAFVQARVEQIGRQAHVNGPAPARQRDADGFADVMAEQFHTLRAVHDAFVTGFAMSAWRNS